MNLLCWNCRGTTAKGFSSLIRDLMMGFHFSFLVLVESHLSGPNATKVSNNLGFDSRFVQEATGQSSGIWCLWDLNHWKVEVLDSSPQFFHM